MSPKDNNPQPGNGQGQPQEKGAFGFNLNRAVNNQGTKKPLVKVDKTSTP